MAAYFTSSDLEISLGGSAVLVQLLDKDGDGVADASAVTAVLNRATAEVNSAIQIAVDLSTLTSPPDSLIYFSANIGAYYAWLMGGQGQAVPQHVRDMYEDAVRWLDQVAKRERSLGAVPRETSDQDVQQIDTNPDGSRVTRASLAGLW